MRFPRNFVYQPPGWFDHRKGREFGVLEFHHARVCVLPESEATPSKICIVRARREPVPLRLTAFSDFLLERWQQAPWDR